MSTQNTTTETCGNGTTERELRAWLDAFATAVRDVDYDAGEQLFAPDVVGFGTVGVLLSGRETLMAAQWKRVWGVHQRVLLRHGPGFDTRPRRRRLDHGAVGVAYWQGRPRPAGP
jgi:hypothetical protein